MRSCHLALLTLASLACQRAPSAAAEREISITGRDYSFAAPDSVSPGRVVFKFHNGGKVDHEMAMALLRPGMSLARVLEVARAGGKPDSLLEASVGILIAKPGETTLGGLALELLPGRTYAMVCNFQDAPDKPRHMVLGMMREIRVTAH